MRRCRVAAIGVALLFAVVPWGNVSASRARIDTASLARGPYSRMHMLLERTIFGVDVLTVSVRVGDETQQTLRRLVQGRQYSDALADQISYAALQIDDAFVRIVFLRDVDLDQFVDGVRENMQHALDAGLIGASNYRRVDRGIPRWFGFLAGRGFKKGDELLYRVRGDSLRTVLRTRDSRVLMNREERGPQPRRALFGAYFAPGSSFREGLIKSLFRER